MFFYKYIVNKQGFFLKKLSKNLENIFSLNLQLNFTKNRQFYDQKLNIEKSNMDRSQMYSILKRFLTSSLDNTGKIFFHEIDSFY